MEFPGECLRKFNGKGTEAALVYNTGYMENVGIISTLCSKDASIIDGCRLKHPEETFQMFVLPTHLMRRSRL